MPIQTSNQSEATFEDLYNVLMEKIEPELCTYTLEEIDKLYADETKNDRKKRYAHYAKCLDFFWQALKELVDLTKEDLNAFNDEFFALLKADISAQEDSDLSDIEDSISKS